MFARIALAALVSVVASCVLSVSPESSCAQGIQIGGPNGVVAGRGFGLRIGGVNGVQFGGGEGARFGPRGNGFQVGGGYGVRVGGWNSGPAYPSARNAQPYQPYQPYAPQYVVPTNSGNPTGLAGSDTPVNARPVVNAPVPASQPADIAAPRPASNPLSSTNRAPAEGQTEYVRLTVPREAGKTVNYTINGTAFQLAPGNSVRMKPGQAWEIGLRDEQGKPKQYTVVEPGEYRFVSSGRGWELKSPIVDGDSIGQSLSSKPDGPVARVAQAPKVSRPSPKTTGDANKSPNNTMTPPAVKLEAPELDQPAVDQPAVDQPAKAQQSVQRPNSVLEFNKDKQ